MSSLVGTRGRRPRPLRPSIGHHLPRIFLLASLLVLTAGSAALAAGPAYESSPISTIAGIGGQAGECTTTCPGDGGPATAAKLNLPFHVAVAADGTYYIADTVNNRIRRVAANGTITTFAGGGNPGDYVGDGLAATLAALYFPAAVVLGPDGALYIADSGSVPCGRVRRVNLSTNIIRTIAGGGEPPVGVGDGGRADLAWLDDPVALAFDAQGNLYICDGFGARVRRVAAAGVADGSGTITTVAGTGVEGFSGDGGAATSARLNLPAGVAFDASGRLYIADSDNNRVRRVSGGIINTFAGNGTPAWAGDGGPAASASLYWPTHLAMDTYGNLYIADNANNRIRRVNSDGIISTVAGNGIPAWGGDGGAASLAYLNGPMGVTIAADERMYIADTANSVIRRVTPTTQNQLPTCSITFTPSTPAWGENINFNANAVDIDGTVVAWAWDFGDGQTGSGATPSHAYITVHEFTVGCTVTDNQGGVGTCETTVSTTPQLVTQSRTFAAEEVGWNLISLPMEPDDPDPFVVFAGFDPVGRVYRYNVGTKGYVGLWSGDPDGFGQMDKYTGYWLNIDEPLTISYVGRRYPPADVDHTLDLVGNPWSWMLIGPGMTSTVPLSLRAFVSQNQGPWIPLCDDDPQTSDGHHESWVLLPFYGWSPERVSYYCVSAVGGPTCDLDTLDPWQGYWVDVEQPNLILRLSPPPT